MVGVTGFEPATSWSQTRRSTKLSYTPNFPDAYHALPRPACRNFCARTCGRFWCDLSPRRPLYQAKLHPEVLLMLGRPVAAATALPSQDTLRLTRVTYHAPARGASRIISWIRSGRAPGPPSGHRRDGVALGLARKLRRPQRRSRCSHRGRWRCNCRARTLAQSLPRHYSWELAPWR